MSRLGGAGAVAQLVADIPLSVKVKKYHKLTIGQYTLSTFAFRFFYCNSVKLGLIVISSFF
jgi:hypothetical protein